MIKTKNDFNIAVDFNFTLIRLGLIDDLLHIHSVIRLHGRIDEKL